MLNEYLSKIQKKRDEFKEKLEVATDFISACVDPNWKNATCYESTTSQRARKVLEVIDFKKEVLDEKEKDEMKELTELANMIHENNVKVGWWTDINTGESTVNTRNVGEVLCLIHSEVSEAMEGYRKSLMDDKLPQYTMFEAELADVLIRVFDLCGAKKIDIGKIVKDKLDYNKNRVDHKIENRKLLNGKRF